MKRETFRVTCVYEVSIPTWVLFLDDMSPAGIAAAMKQNADEDFDDFWEYFMKGQLPTECISVEPK
ncbi:MULTISPECIES: hypothetical protein [unclassified Saccharopolyspora]|uniref:hypothetical protein n=1 Tax=unclassified Saccharopolyspora TaxID=2646250 RepID=UPI001CD6CB28|nr:MULTISPECIES: hypothetical protein [unclassified Saccharopolyspora]MCA1185777.1 hypothetical protein [Saccharopolyspora sp. 6T]MCA1191689.1 hypothetical protein [Saccharopolyspora sp. 6V]